MAATEAVLGIFFRIAELFSKDRLGWEIIFRLPNIGPSVKLEYIKPVIKIINAKPLYCLSSKTILLVAVFSFIIFSKEYIAAIKIAGKSKLE